MGIYSKSCNGVLLSDRHVFLHHPQIGLTISVCMVPLAEMFYGSLLGMLSRECQAIVTRPILPNHQAPPRTNYGVHRTAYNVFSALSERLSEQGSSGSQKFRQPSTVRNRVCVHFLRTFRTLTPIALATTSSLEPTPKVV